ncbi:DMT family transporter [Amnibacterium sp. CER49]|uniref:DMT family transporter n=1 Tax=Amnibacterium sp. CER49 TaxID=3039161 RepID=UPI0024482923|nr:DMT family transporter [Amnibacterium sp. CER49]MDH2443470.1 DMT family transporter [Amnibacterium sp. CER49]
MTRRGWVLFLALGIIWGIPYLFIRLAVRELDPVVLAFGRTVIGSLILLPLALRARGLRPLLRRWKPLLAYTVAEIVGPWVLLGHAETRLNSSTTGLLIATVPIAAAVLVTVLGHDRLDARRVAGLLVGFCGVGLLVGLDFRPTDLTAVLEVLLVVIGYAVGPIIITRFLADLPSIGVVTGSLVVSAVVYAPFALPRWPASVSPVAIGSVVVLAVVCTATAFLVMFALIAEAGPARTSLITYVNPIVAVVLGALVLHEPITIGLAVGFPLIVAGSVLGTWRNRAAAPAAVPGEEPSEVR